METVVSTELAFNLMLLTLCVLLSAFFSASETAITSLGKLKTKHLIETVGPAKDDHLRFWLDHPSRVITTILIFNTVVNILASAIVTKMAIAYSANYGVGIATGIATFLILIFGEVVPKSFGKANAEGLGMTCLHVIHALYRLVFPVVWVLSEAASLMIRALGGAEKTVQPSITEEELEFLINESESEGVIKDFKKDMISGVFDFDETKVREIMTPRTDIAAVEKHESVDELEKMIIKTGHSRIPVYEDTVDNIVGIVFAKDLLRRADSGSDKKNKIADLFREPIFVPESKTIIEVFKDLKRHKVHMAIVIDEHGGTAGIVTMEDILEEIVGEIQDEFDVEEAKIKKVDNNIYDVAGSVNISEFTDFFGIDEGMIEETDHGSDTVGGFMIHLMGAMPKVGQKSAFGPLILEVSELGRRRKRIERIRVTKAAATPAHEARLS